MFFEGVGELDVHGNFRGASQPALEHALSGALVGLLPDLPQAILMVVGDGERFIQRRHEAVEFVRPSSRFSGFFKSSQRVPLRTRRSWSLWAGR